MEFSLWSNKEKRTIDPFLFSSVAEKIAGEFEEAGRRAQRRDGTYDHNKNKSSQIRKFYDEVQRFNTLSKNLLVTDDIAQKDMKWETIHASLHMLIAKAAYAEGRKLTSPNFTDFIRSGVGQIDSPDDLKIFTNLFEALMGYYKLIGPK